MLLLRLAGIRRLSIPSSRKMSTSASAFKSGGNYSEAIAALNTLQSNAAIIEAIRKSGGKLNDFAIPEMIEYLERIGWKQSDLDRLNVIHITGTKGKGSTSAFVDSLIRHTPARDQQDGRPKVGLYTSPHLVQVRERIRLDGKPIDETLFTKFFWEVWNKLEENPNRANPEITPLRPVYFRYLTILAYHVFLKLGVKSTILEVGIGGRYDSTNIVQRPLATGITTLGLDHTALLGNTIEEIAYQKAGIFKKGAPAASVWQHSAGAREVVAKEAEKVGTSSFKQLPELTAASPVQRAKRGIPGEHQASNAQLAVELYRTFLRSDAGKREFKVAESDLDSDELSKVEIEAIENARWPGRCQVVRGKSSSDPVWGLDGAHTAESLEACAAWFVELSNQSSGNTTQSRKTLIFNTTHDRKSEELLSGMLKAIAEKRRDVNVQDNDLFFDHVIFCTNITYKEGKSAGDLTSVAGPVSLEAQETIQKAWKVLDKDIKTKSDVLPSIEEAIQAVNQQKAENHYVLVCGSLHLVGGVMSHLKDVGLLDESLNGVIP